jgi:hypothetical protein
MKGIMREEDRQVWCREISSLEVLEAGGGRIPSDGGSRMLLGLRASPFRLHDGLGSRRGKVLPSVLRVWILATPGVKRRRLLWKGSRMSRVAMGLRKTSEIVLTPEQIFLAKA